jgi:AraC-like DNA-binding protein
MRYILEHATDGRARLTEAADIAGLSPAAFSRYFARVCGQGFSDVLRKLRIANACRLLRDTDLPIAQVGAESGYANLSNFNRQFLALMECTPRDYRRGAERRLGATTTAGSRPR